MVYCTFRIFASSENWLFHICILSSCIEPGRDAWRWRSRWWNRFGLYLDGICSLGVLAFYFYHWALDLTINHVSDVECATFTTAVCSCPLVVGMGHDTVIGLLQWNAQRASLYRNHAACTWDAQFQNISQWISSLHQSWIHCVTAMVSMPSQYSSGGREQRAGPLCHSQTCLWLSHDCPVRVLCHLTCFIVNSIAVTCHKQLEVSGLLSWSRSCRMGIELFTCQCKKVNIKIQSGENIDGCFHGISVASSFVQNGILFFSFPLSFLLLIPFITNLSAEACKDKLLQAWSVVSAMYRNRIVLGSVFLCLD